MTAKRLLTLLLMVIALASTGLAKDKVLASGTTDGVFLRTETGDYVHFVIKDAKGQEQSFFIVKGDGTVEKFVKAPARYKGRKVRVKWQEVMSNIPEAGGPMKIRQVTSASLR
jgi:hypothetical protein